MRLNKKNDDVIEVKESAKSQLRIKDSLKLADAATFPEWVEIDMTAMKGVYKRTPDRSELPSEINEQLVIELYSK